MWSAAQPPYEPAATIPQTCAVLCTLKALERVAPGCIMAIKPTAAGKYNDSVSPIIPRQKRNATTEPLEPAPSMATLHRIKLAMTILSRRIRSARRPETVRHNAYTQRNVDPTKPS